MFYLVHVLFSWVFSVVLFSIQGIFYLANMYVFYLVYIIYTCVLFSRCVLFNTHVFVLSSACVCCNTVFSTWFFLSQGWVLFTIHADVFLSSICFI